MGNHLIMPKESILKEKCYALGLLIVGISKYLREKKNQGVLYNQLLRSGTAVGALICEAEFAQFKADFINKISVALKEANEANYWLNILKDSGDIDHDRYQPASALSNEVIRMLVSSIRTAKGIKPAT